MVMILSYVTDGQRRTFTRAESTRLISQASPVPVLGMHSTRLGHGIMGGMLLNGWEHGSREGYLAGAFPVDESEGSQPMFDNLILKRFGLAASALPPER